MAREITVWPGRSQCGQDCPCPMLLKALVSPPGRAASPLKKHCLGIYTTGPDVYPAGAGGVGLGKGCRRREQAGDKMGDETLMWELITETFPTAGRYLPS